MLGKITFKVISDLNQNYLTKINLKSASKSLTCEVNSNQNLSCVAGQSGKLNSVRIFFHFIG